MAEGVPGRLRPQIFLTFRHYKGGRSSAKCTGHLYPRRNPWHSLSEVESTSGHMVLSGVPRKKSPVTPPGIDPWTDRLVAQRLNHYATPGPYFINVSILTTTHIKITCLCYAGLKWAANERFQIHSYYPKVKKINCSGFKSNQSDCLVCVHFRLQFFCTMWKNTCLWLFSEQ